MRWTITMLVAGFLTCCVADFQIGRPRTGRTPRRLETRDTADSEVRATNAQISKSADGEPARREAGKKTLTLARIE
ncbi:MAG: hypothetical protein M1608_08875 [Candidatus Omnitrophica bacterium]|nr:hypothetical protein [Candidatus Omnitrophota bacterium]